MLEAITPEIRKKLGEIGFEKDEINAIEIIRELKKNCPTNINEILNEIAAKKNRDGLLKKIDELSWKMGERKFINRRELYDR